MKHMENPIVVTRHPALVAYLTEIGMVPPGTTPIPHVADPAQIRGRNVIGVLPLHLAALAASVTEIPLNAPLELRGSELSLQQVREFAGPPRTFVVRAQS